MKRSIVIGLALLFVVTACGDSDSGRSEAISAVKAGILESAGDDESLPISDAQAQCTAERVVDGLGVERVNELGFEATRTANAFNLMSDAEINQLVDAIFGCVELAELFLSGIEPGIIGEASGQCIADALLESNVFRAAMVDAVRGTGGDFAELPPEDQQEMALLMLDCLTPEEFAKLSGQ